MMIAHYIHLMRHERMPLGDELIVRGTLERLAPVLMTALTAVIGLIPLALGAGQTGKEILHPLAIVVIGGLIDSTLMDQIVTPAAFKLFGKYVYHPNPPAADGSASAARQDDWLREPAGPTNHVVPSVEAGPTPPAAGLIGPAGLPVEDGQRIPSSGRPAG